MEFTTTVSLNKILTSSNLATELTERELSSLGQDIHQNFEADLNSRVDWEIRNEEAMKLALQIKEEKNFPWPNASNIKFPLITIAALQYHARAYPVLIGSDTPVKCKIVGQDPEGTKKERATRVENHMSYQVIEQDEAWESETDKVLITQPILGCAFKKSYFDTIKRHNVSEYILPKDLVVNYWAKDLETAPRVTHVLYMSKNDIYERVTAGIWEAMSEETIGEKETTPLVAARDEAQGTTPPPTRDSSTPYEILEHHCYLDLDDDGYEEPYIVYMRRDTKQVLRIVARFFEEGVQKRKGKVLSIKPEQYFTKFPFIPSPDGGFYDLGFGVLLGPLNDSINTLINQLVDAGTMSNTAGGFLSRGVKMRGGSYSFSPLEWKHVETTGEDLQKGIMPLPVREPSQVLFTLLSLLINYGERIGGSVDALSGISPGQNTPAETSRNSVEQGMKIFSGIFKRTYRSLRDEFRKLYRLNQLYIVENVNFTDARDNTGTVLTEDYVGDVSSIRPSADPSIVSDSQRIQQADAIRQAAYSAPGYDTYAVERQYLTALKVNNIDELLPDPKGPNAIKPAPDVKIQIEQMKLENSKLELQANMKMEQMKFMLEVEKTKEEIEKMRAEKILILAQVDSVEKTHQVNLLNSQIGAAKANQDSLVKYITAMKSMEQSMQTNSQEGATSAAS